MCICNYIYILYIVMIIMGNYINMIICIHMYAYNMLIYDIYRHIIQPIITYFHVHLVLTL